MLLVLASLSAFSGCAAVPIKDGELVINSNTTATMDDMSVARVKSQF